jgi:hypothetical protein
MIILTRSRLVVRRNDAARIVLAVIAAAALASCGVSLHHSATLALPKSCREGLGGCSDGRPVFIIQGLSCDAGICGYTCAANRWEITGRP